jgi:arylformamidase
MQDEWIDVTVPLRTGMAHWPDNPPVLIEPVKEIAKGGSSNVSRIEMGSHTGTHIDAPAHFIPGGSGIDKIDLDALIGPARVITILNREVITPAEIATHNLAQGDRVLFRTRNSTDCWRRSEFMTDFVYLNDGAAERLVSIGVRTVGIDYLSVAGYRRQDAKKTHPILLGAGIVIIEGLDLYGVPDGRYEMICLPLRIEGGDGSPARAVLKPLGQK